MSVCMSGTASEILFLDGFCFIELRYDLPASYKFHKKKSVSFLNLAYLHSVLKNFSISNYFQCYQVA